VASGEWRVVSVQLSAISCRLSVARCGLYVVNDQWSHGQSTTVNRQLSFHRGRCRVKSRVPIAISRFEAVEPRFPFLVCLC
jgi:hypothetical protein